MIWCKDRAVGATLVGLLMQDEQDGCVTCAVHGCNLAAVCSLVQGCTPPFVLCCGLDIVHHLNVQHCLRAGVPRSNACVISASSAHCKGGIQIAVLVLVRLWPPCKAILLSLCTYALI
eukprot:1132744-Pelagomonas_calceolata.AAC.3